ncbi:hypothetical protein KFE25_008707 [Diacronema lutheri]|uniref:Glutamate-rich WD repeat-containing protein 1 n=2 Tax=Diacronema lutheri TaxID=2081491 RepID=A0A8J6CGN2_DIALT|nr:hypothetical protein KFE25_008707 [Diacronema lutheri]
MSAPKKGRGDGGKPMDVAEAPELELRLKADLEYEDEAEDEFEEEEIVAYGDESDDSDREAAAAPPPLDDDAAQANGDGAETRVWRAGVDQLAPDEELEFDPSAYDVMHSFHSDWPCLTFAIVPDQLGSGRTKAPFSAALVAGTQASQPSDNKLLVMKVSKLPRIRHERDDDDMDDDDDDDDDEAEEEPVMEHRAVRHEGTVNRLCLMPQQPAICATWSDTGKVHLWNLDAMYGSLGLGAPGAAAPQRAKPLPEVRPLFSFGGHSAEGFAVDFSKVEAGRLATGDCDSKICVWNASADGRWTVDEQPYTGHSSSVEDIRWSPVEATVFASCSADGTIGIWDVRKRTGSALSVKAHETDANVISWNGGVSYLLVSGADDGCFKIWDLRSFRAGSPVASFAWHKAPITSLEWNPNEHSSLAVSGADNQLTLWDMALEDDPEAQQAAVGRDDLADIPPQLYFVHQGQTNMKELHWHAQMPGMVLSTAEDGFHMFRPAN